MNGENRLRMRRHKQGCAVIKPDGDDYWVRSEVQRHRFAMWTWTANLRQRRRWLPNDLAYLSGSSLTRKRAQRAADRAAAQLKREAAALRNAPSNSEENR